MSFESMKRYEFLSLGQIRKTEGDTFTVYVKGYRQLETKFGVGNYLIVEVGERTRPKSKQKLQEGLLKISATTGASIALLVPELEHLEQMKHHWIDFEYNEDVRTILAVKVREGIQ